jgi:hypothetical protein
MPNIFAVVGESRDDPDRLLLIGDDGRHYEYELPTGATTPIVPDDAWLFDPNDAIADEFLG